MLGSVFFALLKLQAVSDPGFEGFIKYLSRLKVVDVSVALIIGGSRIGYEEMSAYKLISSMSEQRDLEASEPMHGSENLCSLSQYTCSSLVAQKHSQMHGSFEEEIPFIIEYKQNDLSDVKDVYDNEKKELGASLKENLMVTNKDNAEEALDSEAEDSPIEDLIHALEVHLNINSSDNQALCKDLPGTGDDLSCKDKKKRRKKRKGPTKNPNQIFAFSEGEQKKIEHSKLPSDTNKAVTCKTLSKSATFPVFTQDAISSKDVPILTVEKFESANKNGPESEYGFPDGRSSFYIRTVSFPPSLKLTPAIRGGHEKNGLGPRPKFCVKWAPDVYEPPRTSVSHTVKSYHHCQSKKKGHKNKQKGKSGTGSIKHDKKLMCNQNCNTEGVCSRLQLSSQRTENRMFSDDRPLRASALMPDKTHLTALKAPLFNTQMDQNAISLNIESMNSEHCHINEGDDFAGECTEDLMSEGKGNFQSSSEADFQFSQDLKCSSSFLHTIESKHLSYAEATK